MSTPTLRGGRHNFCQVTVLKFGDLIEEWKFSINAKFQHNIFKIEPARPEKPLDQYSDLGLCNQDMTPKPQVILGSVGKWVINIHLHSV